MTLASAPTRVGDVSTRPPVQPKRPTRSRLARIDARYGYLFVAPALIGFLVFVAIPLVGVLYFSLHDYNSLSGRFAPVGFENYADLFQSAVFQTVLRNTLIFSLGVIPGNIILGMLLALLMNQRLPAIGIFRTAYFVPAVISLVAWTLVWEHLMQTSGGINGWLATIGIQGPAWLNDSTWSMVAVITVQILKNVGISAVLLLAALQDIPEEIIEASVLDGAGPGKRFWFIMRPLISPTLLMVAILATINSLKAFAQIFLLTGGGPGYSTTVLGYYIYERAFVAFQLGYASTAAVVLFIIILGLTLLQWWSRKRWVYVEE